MSGILLAVVGFGSLKVGLGAGVVYTIGFRLLFGHLPAPFLPWSVYLVIGSSAATLTAFLALLGTPLAKDSKAWYYTLAFAIPVATVCSLGAFHIAPIATNFLRWLMAF